MISLYSKEVLLNLIDDEGDASVLVGNPYYN